MRRHDRGSSVAEALVATLLAGIAVAGLAATAAGATRALRLARASTIAVGLAGARLEALRTGPRADGGDVVADAGMLRFARRWTASGGRGRPAALTVRVTWDGHAFATATEALP